MFVRSGILSISDKTCGKAALRRAKVNPSGVREAEGVPAEDCCSRQCALKVTLTEAGAERRRPSASLCCAIKTQRVWSSASRSSWHTETVSLFFFFFCIDHVDKTWTGV